MSNTTERQLVKDTLKRASQRVGVMTTFDAESYYGAAYGEILTCASCGLQVRADYQYQTIKDEYTNQSRSQYCVPDGFVFLSEGWPDEMVAFINGEPPGITYSPPLHICDDCFRVHSGLTDTDIEEIVAETEHRMEMGVDDLIALTEACQIWAGVNLPFAGNEPEVWIVVEEQVKDWKKEI